MKCINRLLAVVLTAFFIAGSALAQTSPVSNHAVPIGKGPGQTGYTSVAPGTAGIPLVSNGASSDPSFAALACGGLPAGVDCNTINLQIANYSAVSADCGKTVVLGGSVQFTLTVGTASGFAATCSIVITNIDTGRGKKMVINGVTFPNNNILWPGQSFILKNESNLWTIIYPPGRWKLSGNVQFEVNSGAADDNNDGLATGAANAFKTINGGIGVMSSILDANNQGVTLHTNCAAGPITYTESIRFLPIVGQQVGNSVAAALTPTLTGDTTTPTNCILTSTGGATVQAIGQTQWNIQGFKLTNTDGSSACVLVDQQSWIRAGNMNFGSCNGASGNHIVVENYSGYEPMANYTISAGASSHVYATLLGNFVQTGVTVTLTGTPAFAFAFAYSERNAVQYWGSATFSGSATGPRYVTVLGGGIETAGSGATFLPGNSAGSATNPGWYN